MPTPEPMQQVLQRLQAAGISAELSLSGITIAVPRRPVIRTSLQLLIGSSLAMIPTALLHEWARLSQWLDGPMLRVPLTLLFVVAGLGIVSGLAALAIGLLIAMLQRLFPRLRGWLSRSFTITPQAILLPDRSLSLEEITSVSLRKVFDGEVLEVGHRGEVVWLSLSERHQQETLRALLSTLVEQRRMQLHAQGHDLSVEAEPPAQLQQVRERS